MHITQWGEFGILCSLYIAQREQEASGESAKTPIGAADIATAQGFSLEYAQQILQRLRRSGVLESVRGPQGGYRLARQAREISIYDILIATEGDSFEVICDSKPINEERCAQNNFCGLRPFWHQLKDHVNEFLRARSLQDLLEESLRATASSETKTSTSPIQIGERTR